MTHQCQCHHQACIDRKCLKEISRTGMEKKGEKGKKKDFEHTVNVTRLGFISALSFPLEVYRRIPVYTALLLLTFVITL